MKILQPETYLIGLIAILLIFAILVGRQLLRVRNDEINLIKLEKGGASSSKEASELYELATVQIRKRLYPQAITTLRKALKQLNNEPDEAKAVIENALGFALAAQDDFESAIVHYKNALKSKPDYPVALNNLGFAKQKLLQTDEALKVYQEVLSLDPKNKTARKQVQKIQKLMENQTANSEAKNNKGFN